MFVPLLPGSSIKCMVIGCFFEIKEGNENKYNSACDFYFYFIFNYFF